MTLAYEVLWLVMLTALVIQVAVKSKRRRTKLGRLQGAGTCDDDMCMCSKMHYASDGHQLQDKDGQLWRHFGGELLRDADWYKVRELERDIFGVMQLHHPDPYGPPSWWKSSQETDAQRVEAGKKPHPIDDVACPCGYLSECALYCGPDVVGQHCHDAVGKVPDVDLAVHHKAGKPAAAFGRCDVCPRCGSGSRGLVLCGCKGGPSGWHYSSNETAIIQAHSIPPPQMGKDDAKCANRRVWDSTKVAPTHDQLQACGCKECVNLDEWRQSWP